MPNPFDPRDHNRYAYVRNNSLKYTDPTGRCIGNLPCPRKILKEMAEQLTSDLTEYVESTRESVSSAASTARSTATGTARKAKEIAFVVAQQTSGIDHFETVTDPTDPDTTYPVAIGVDSGNGLLPAIVDFFGAGDSTAVMLPGIVIATKELDPPNVAHEAQHIREWRNDPVGWYFNYFYDSTDIWLTGGDPYYDNPAEIRASGRETAPVWRPSPRRYRDTTDSWID